MNAVLKHVNWRAVGVSVLAAYVLPVIAACFATSFAMWLFALWVLAPLCAGFLVARWAKSIPLIHGLVVSLVAIAIFILVYDVARFVTGFYFVFWIILNVACSISGAWLWQRRSRAAA
jgi:hypothetical protein